MLLVEDDASDRASLTRSLERAGLRVSVAATGQAALELGRTQRFSAIILDLVLPDMSGWDVLNAIREASPNQSAPVVAVTAVARERGLAIAHRIHDFLVKPVQDADLLDVLERAGLPITHRRSILVIDDDPRLLALMERTLGRLGYRPVCVASARQGLDQLQTEPPAAIILELAMPDMRGVDFLETRRGIDGVEDVPVVAWTARELTVADGAYLKTAAIWFVQKGPDGTLALLEELQELVPPNAPEAGE